MQILWMPVGDDVKLVCRVWWICLLVGAERLIRRELQDQDDDRACNKLV